MSVFKVRVLPGLGYTSPERPSLNSQLQEIRRLEIRTSIVFLRMGQLGLNMEVRVPIRALLISSGTRVHIHEIEIKAEMLLR